MSITTRYESVPVDGDHFDVYVALPEAGRGPGILLFQEIFGINDNIRGLAQRLAELGFIAVAPDMFWRIERRFERHDESGMADAFSMVQRFDFATAVTDIQAAHAHLLEMGECTGKVGAMGFCLGGGLAFAAATSSRVDGKGVDAAVCYYGSAINSMLGQVEQLECPVMFHYGTRDQYIPTEAIDEVERAVATKAGVEFHRYDAGHAFSNWDAPTFYDQPAADRAWPRSVSFLDRYLK